MSGGPTRGRHEPGAVSDAADDAVPPILHRIARLYRLHLVVSAAFNAALAAVNVASGGGWWTFWPALASWLLLGLHYLIFKVATVDESWAEMRTDDLRSKSYDLAHIHSIAERGGPGLRDQSKGPPPGGT
jgi:hypothetical protein